MSSRTRTRRAAVVLGFAATASLALTACGSNSNVPSAGHALTHVSTSQAPTTSAPKGTFETQVRADNPATYSKVGDFSADQVKAAVTTAESAVYAAANGTLASDLVAQPTDQRVAVFAEYLSADAKAFFLSPQGASTLEGFVLDPGTDKPGVEKVTGNPGVTVYNTKTYVAPDTGLLVVQFNTKDTITTNQPDGSAQGTTYTFPRLYTIEMSPAPGTSTDWLISRAQVQADSPTKAPAGN